MTATWYEVFQDMGEEDGTETIESFDTLEEARAYKTETEKEGINPYTLKIDRWINTNTGPIPVGECH